MVLKAKFRKLIYIPLDQISAVIRNMGKQETLKNFAEERVLMTSMIQI